MRGKTSSYCVSAQPLDLNIIKCHIFVDLSLRDNEVYLKQV